MDHIEVTFQISKSYIEKKENPKNLPQEISIP